MTSNTLAEVKDVYSNLVRVRELLESRSREEYEFIRCGATSPLPSIGIRAQNKLKDIMDTFSLKGSTFYILPTCLNS